MHHREGFLSMSIEVDALYEWSRCSMNALHKWASSCKHRGGIGKSSPIDTNNDSILSVDLSTNKNFFLSTKKQIFDQGFPLRVIREILWIGWPCFWMSCETMWFFSTGSEFGRFRPLGLIRHVSNFSSNSQLFDFRFIKRLSSPT